MAEGVGFEPTEEFPPHTLSRRAESAALASLQNRIQQVYTLIWLRNLLYHGLEIMARKRWRREWDLNPRGAINTYRFSRAAPSTSRTSLPALLLYYAPLPFSIWLKLN